jgi:L-ascorbate metabolism protein UlaG (beta-lactamase superfamily)
MSITLTSLGHSGYLIHDHRSDQRVCIDPFLTGNNLAVNTPDEIDCDVLLLTHGHPDHFNEDTFAICERCKPLVIAPFELADELGENHGHKNVAPGNPGGSVRTDFGYVSFTPALHSSSYEGRYMGVPVGFVLHFRPSPDAVDDAVVYHAGDTALFSDMQLVGQIADVDIALLPAGGRFTMTPELAARAAEMVEPKLAIPMHYGTMPVMATAEQVAERFKPEGIDTRMLKPGESLDWPE